MHVCWLLSLCDCVGLPVEEDYNCCVRSCCWVGGMCVCDGDFASSLISGGDGACGDVAPVDAGHVALLVMVAAAE